MENYLYFMYYTSTLPNLLHGSPNNELQIMGSQIKSSNESRRIAFARRK